MIEYSLFHQKLVACYKNDLMSHNRNVPSLIQLKENLLAQIICCERVSLGVKCVSEKTQSDIAMASSQAVISPYLVLSTNHEVNREKTTKVLLKMIGLTSILLLVYITSGLVIFTVCLFEIGQQICKHPIAGNCSIGMQILLAVSHLASISFCFIVCKGDLTKISLFFAVTLSGIILDLFFMKSIACFILVLLKVGTLACLIVIEESKVGLFYNAFISCLGSTLVCTSRQRTINFVALFDTFQMSATQQIVLLLFVASLVASFMSKDYCDLSVDQGICLYGGQKVISPPGKPKGLVGKWDFDDELLLDSSGISRHAQVLPGSGRMHGPGVNDGGSSLRVSGKNYIEVPFAFGESNEYSVMFWVHITKESTLE